MQRRVAEAQFSVAKDVEDNDEKHKPSSQALSYYIASQVFL